MRLLPYFVRILSVLIIFLGAACAGPDGAGGRSSSANDETLIIYTDDDEYKFYIELADDDDERRMGLMYRTELAGNAGMLFDFGEPQPVSMWMKNTLIPLDMAFIDETGEIRRIAANTTPRSLESVHSGAAVTAVLEVNGGTFERLGVEEGDKVAHPIFKSE